MNKITEKQIEDEEIDIEEIKWDVSKVLSCLNYDIFFCLFYYLSC